MFNMKDRFIELKYLDKDKKKFTLRISERTLNRIDVQCKKRIGNISRNTWILEIIEKALKKEESKV